MGAKDRRADPDPAPCRMITELGDLRPHLNLFVDGECIRFTNGFATPVRDGAEIVILPALSGG